MLRRAGMQQDFIASALAWVRTTVEATPAEIGTKFPRPLLFHGVHNVTRADACEFGHRWIRLSRYRAIKQFVLDGILS